MFRSCKLGSDFEIEPTSDEVFLLLFMSVICSPAFIASFILLQ